MKRPILDQIATFVFKLENDRVANSSIEDDKGRNGEPMEWAEENSFANQFSEMVSSNDDAERRSISPSPSTSIANTHLA